MKSGDYKYPCAKSDLNLFFELVNKSDPFTFIRFSDGELEIIRNRKLIIDRGITTFRGKTFENKFPDFDKKIFNPIACQKLRHDLLESSMYASRNYFKGIPTSHNRALHDRELLLRLNGGYSSQITFSDLFLNSNFISARKIFFPYIINSFERVTVIGNWRCKLNSDLAKACLIPIPDDFFSSYEPTLKSVLFDLENIPSNSLVLSSASSLSNILGYRLRVSRPDLTFLDIGTVLNDQLGLSLGTRAYHKLMLKDTFLQGIYAWFYMRKAEYKIKW